MASRCRPYDAQDTGFFGQLPVGVRVLLHLFGSLPHSDAARFPMVRSTVTTQFGSLASLPLFYLFLSGEMLPRSLGVTIQNR